MNRMKIMGVFALAALLTLATVKLSMADDAAKSVTGTSSCGGCSGVATGCCVMLTDSSGDRWILRGENDSVKAAFKARHDKKKMTATYSGEPSVKKGGDGKDYKEVTVTTVKVEG